MEELSRGINKGILAIWNDCNVGDENIYESWYQSEHLAERLKVTGFLRGRRFQRVTGDSGYFTYYETEGPEVLVAPEYLKLLENPSPLTERIMSGTFLNMSRTACRVAYRFGQIYGAFAVTVRLDDLKLIEAASKYARTLFDQPSVARAEIWTADEDRSRAKTREENLRGDDEQIKACLIVETLRKKSTREISEKVCEYVGVSPSSIGSYQLLCDIQSKGKARD